MALASTRASSRVLSPFRAVGVISNHVALSIQVRGTEHFVTTAVGKTFHIYNCTQLNLLFVGEVQDHNIDLLASHGEHTATASKNIIRLWKRGKMVKEFDKHTADVKFLLPFAEHMISIDEQNVMKIWNVKDLDTYLTLAFIIDDFDITTALHPNTYLNKILMASRQGTMQLWNIKTSKLIYEFNGWSEPILVLEQAPAVDVVAIGLESGRIVLHNLKYDASLVTFVQDFGPVTSISFRTDGASVMATGSTQGHLSFWDLENRTLQSCLRDCHNGSLAGMKFLLNKPLLLTSGSDNCLKLWIFDNSDGSGRLLKYRAGHSQPPTLVRFYGTNGHILLSAGLDRSLRYTSTIRDEQSCEMSQGSLMRKSKSLGLRVEELKLPPITHMDAEPTRASDWDNVVTCHAGSALVQTWKLQNRCIGKHSLGKDIEKLRGSVATVARISSCGNFIVVGYSTGFMEVFNLQSGVHRGSFVASKDKAHLMSIRGIAVDSANVKVISGSSDGFVKFWNFNSRKIEWYEILDCPIRQLLLHKESSLLAVTLEDFTVKVIDIDTKKIVRNFVGHQHSITDMAFSPDARWLLTASMDTSIRIWDLPSARLIDCFLLDSPITSLSFSPTGDFLATCHLDEIGIYLWSNKTSYNDIYLSPLPRDYIPGRIQLPSTLTLDENYEVPKSGSDEVIELDNTVMSYQSPAQISSEIITLSTLPDSRWKNLLDLKLLKERNKPREPLKKPKAAPFFLPTISGLEPKFDTNRKEKSEDTVRYLPTKFFSERTKFQKVLFDCSASKDYGAAVEMLKEMSPSAIDVEFRLAAPEGGGSVDALKLLLEFFNECLGGGRNYELIQAYIGLFLKLHGKQIVLETSLRKLTMEILDSEKSSWHRCQELVNQSTCLINYFKSATL